MDATIGRERCMKRSLPATAFWGVTFIALAGVAHAQDPSTLTLHFPADRCGCVLVNLDSPTSHGDRNDWLWPGRRYEKVAKAQGEVTVPSTMRLGAVISGSAIQECDVPQLLDELAALPNLEALHFGPGDFIGDAAGALTRFKKLLRLEFADVTDQDLMRLPPIATLKQLWIEGKHEGFSVETFANLARQPALETLSVRSDYSDEAVAQLKGLKSLKRLGFCSLIQEVGTISDTTLAHLGEMTSLESLSLYAGCFTDDGLKYLARLPNLKALEVPTSSFSEQGLKYIATFPALEDLHLRADVLTDEGLKHLADLPNLRVLYMFLWPSSGVSLKCITTFPALEELHLDTDAITDADILCLADSACLRKLVLHRNRNVTESALAALRKRKPGLITEADPPRASQESKDTGK